MSKLLSENQNVIKRIFWGLLIASPFVSVCLLCAFQGGSIFDIYLPNSLWNDEVFYYKQIEAMVHYGIPQGYFGYDEIPALYLTFGTWSPFLLAPYAVYGLFFGWTLASPIIANLLFMTIAFGVLVLVLRPEIQSSICLFLFNLFFILGSRYFVSGMAETVCFSFTIILTAMLIKMIDRKSKLSIYIIYLAIATYATLMRPYFVIFIFTVVIINILNRKFLYALISTFFAIASTITYFLFENMFAAPFYIPVTKTGSYIQALVQGDILTFLHLVLTNLSQSLNEIFIVATNFENIGYVNVIYLLYILLFFCVIIKLIYAFSNKNEADKKIFFSVLFIMLSVFFAVALFYYVEAGSRHLNVFIYTAVIVLSLDKFRIDKAMILLLVLISSFLCSKDAYWYNVSMSLQSPNEQIKKATQTLTEVMPVAVNSHDRFENTIAYIFQDVDKDGQLLVGKYNYLYFFPKGYGYNFIITKTEDFKSKYIYLRVGGAVEQYLLEYGERSELVIEEWDETAVYLNPLFDAQTTID